MVKALIASTYLCHDLLEPHPYSQVQLCTQSWLIGGRVIFGLCLTGIYDSPAHLRTRQDSVTITCSYNSLSGECNIIGGLHVASELYFYDTVSGSS